MKGELLGAQPCPTLCDPMAVLCPWDSPDKNTGVGSHSLLQGIFPTQGQNCVSCIAGSFSIASMDESLNVRHHRKPGKYEHQNYKPFYQ